MSCRDTRAGAWGEREQGCAGDVVGEAVADAAPEGPVARIGASFKRMLARMGKF